MLRHTQKLAAAIFLAILIGSPEAVRATQPNCTFEEMSRRLEQSIFDQIDQSYENGTPLFPESTDPGAIYNDLSSRAGRNLPPYTPTPQALQWRVLSDTRDASTHQRIIVARNEASGKTETIRVPWRRDWDQQEKYFEGVHLPFRFVPESRDEYFARMNQRHTDPKARAMLNAGRQASEASYRRARQAQSVAIDWLVHSGHDAIKAHPDEAQLVLLRLTTSKPRLRSSKGDNPSKVSCLI